MLIICRRYNIYDECGSDTRRLDHTTASHPPSSLVGLLSHLSQDTVLVTTSDSFQVSAGYDYPCGEKTAMTEYLAEPSVMDALHVLPNTIGMVYQKTAGDLIPLYSRLIERYPILFYAGDTDACIPYNGVEKWTQNLNATLINGWHQWVSPTDPQHSAHKAGYALTYDKFQVITVNGAGHMVPRYQPAFALHMFNKFLRGELF